MQEGPDMRNRFSTNGVFFFRQHLVVARKERERERKEERLTIFNLAAKISRPKWSS